METRERRGEVQAGCEDRGWAGLSFPARCVAHPRVPPGIYKWISGRTYRIRCMPSTTRYFLPYATGFHEMELDDSKYLLQLARADVLTLPESPGDWNSVTVKSPKEGIKPRLATHVVDSSISYHHLLTLTQTAQLLHKIPPIAPRCLPTPLVNRPAQAPPDHPRPHKQHNAPQRQHRPHHPHKRGKTTKCPHQAIQDGKVRGPRVRRHTKAEGSTG